MDFSFSATTSNPHGDREDLRPVSDDYWLAKDQTGGFPHDFHRALAEQGWIGIAILTAVPGWA